MDKSSKPSFNFSNEGSSLYRCNIPCQHLLLPYLVCRRNFVLAFRAARRIISLSFRKLVWHEIIDGESISYSHITTFFRLLFIRQYIISFYPACGKIPVKIIIKEVNCAKPDIKTHEAVELCVWQSLSCIVEDVDPEDTTERLNPTEERMVLKFLLDFQNQGYTVKHVGFEPLVLNIECLTTASLDKLTKENSSGNLAEQLEVCLLQIISRKLDISELLLETKISIHEYKLCKRKLNKEGKQ